MNKHLLSILIFFALLTTSTDGYSKSKIEQIQDSIHSVMQNPTVSDSLKVVHIAELALMDHYLEPYNLRSLGHTQQAMKIAKTLKQDNSKVFIYAVRMFLENNAAQSGIAMDSCLYYTEKSKNPLIRSIGWQNVGRMKTHTSEAYDYLQKALDEVKNKGYWLQEQSIYYDITHHHHITIEDYPSLITYAKLALDAAIKSEDNYTIAKSWHDLGVAYYMNFSKNPEDTSLGDEAQFAFWKTHEFYTKAILDYHVRSEQLLYVTTLVNISNLAYVKGDIESTIKALNEALSISLEYNQNSDIDYSLKPYVYHDSKLYILQCYSTLSNLYKEKKEYRKAEEYLLKALNFLPKNMLDDVRNGTYPAYRFNFSLADLYAEMGDNKKAVEYYVIGFEEYQANYEYQLKGMHDHLEAAYQTQKKDNELATLQEMIDLKKKLNFLYIGILVILVAILILLYYFLHFRLKASKQREASQKAESRLIEMRKQQAELKARLNAQESERLQKELLAGSLLVEHKNRTFENLKQFFAQNTELIPYKKEIENVLLEKIDNDSDAEEFKTDVQDVHPEFYARLQEKAENKLTALDLQYCRCIYMKMSSKEMADILHVDPKTIRVNKYRLKLKLKLGKEIDLNKFIEHIV